MSTISAAMQDSPPSEAIRQAVGIHISMLSRQTRRDYAGFAVGKRRKMEIVPFIAKEIAKKILLQVVLDDAGMAADAVVVAKRIEEVLTAYPETDAFLIASHSLEESEPARDELTRQITLDLLQAYTPVTIEHERECAAPLSNGWKMWEVIPAGEEPAYRWQRTWSGKVDDDFIGFDNDLSIGRIFHIDHIQQSDKWFWLLGYPGTRMRREVPASGWEDTMRQAACRVERCYKSVVELNRASKDI
ncbi:hypothetical protein OIU34_27820 [Pararhizobium sp. BT-229]|uniref:hypothetical protein n=1 Tax=Pararhizobium sp. BT-229 TaxID=2986923 RepID=UPI0021F7CBE4|nr:hypothetical protein [Pararhizobium sp. BT-229]MCV9965686.1 hypothetical protein [Pararhizobium sp. BT-229]